MHVTLRNPNCQKTVLDNGATLEAVLFSFMKASKCFVTAERKRIQKVPCFRKFPVLGLIIETWSIGT